jgi:hypothetical protein
VTPTMHNAIATSLALMSPFCHGVISAAMLPVAADLVVRIGRAMIARLPANGTT